MKKELKKRLPAKVGPAAGQSSSRATPDLPSHDTKRTATVERVPDPKGFDLEAAWDMEWERNLWDAAIARVKAQVKPKQFQMFDLYALKEWPVKEVARALGVSVTLVYVNKHRVARMIKKELKNIEAKLV